MSNIVFPSLYWISSSQWHVTTQPLCVQVRTERGMYHFRSACAAASSDAMSTVIDGADQAQYGLPYFAQDDKSTTNALKYKVWTINCSATYVRMPFVCIVSLCLPYNCRQDCMLLLCMGSLLTHIFFPGTCQVAPMLWLRLFTGPFSHGGVSQIGCPLF